jgi:hypothetical protein
MLKCVQCTNIKNTFKGSKLTYPMLVLFDNQNTRIVHNPEQLELLIELLCKINDTDRDGIFSKDYRI